MPPEIVSIPSRLTVVQGDSAEIRCVAKSTDESELFFLWYETDSGKREDIYAVNRGSETSDYLICDTDTVGTRNYICQVSSENGGLTYSSVVSVTVTEKQTVERPEEELPQPIEPVTQPTKPVTEPTTIPATNDAEHSKAQNEDGNNSAMLWIIPGAVLLVAVTAVVTVYIVKRK